MESIRFFCFVAQFSAFCEAFVFLWLFLTDGMVFWAETGSFQERNHSKISQSLKVGRAIPQAACRI